MANLRKVIVVGGSSHGDIDGIIEVNGIKYQRVPTQISKPLNGKLLAIMMAYGFEYRSRFAPRHPDVSDIDIVHEFGLIEQKKSELNRFYRDRVISIFNRNFKKL